MLLVFQGASKLTSSLLSEIKSKKIDFVIANGENATAQGCWFDRGNLQRFL